jgi:hypothetical protein
MTTSQNQEYRVAATPAMSQAVSMSISGLLEEGPAGTDFRRERAVANAVTTNEAAYLNNVNEITRWAGM